VLATCDDCSTVIAGSCYSTVAYSNPVGAANTIPVQPVYCSSIDTMVVYDHGICATADMALLAVHDHINDAVMHC